MKVEFNNPAGRLLAALSSAQGKQTPKDLASAFGVGADWSSLLRAMHDLITEFDLLVDAIERYKENATKYTLYKSKVDIISKSLYSFHLITGGGGNQQGYRSHVSPEALVALEFIAADLPQEEPADESELEALRKSIDELRQQVERADDLTAVIRKWLLDLIRLMRDGIDRYSVRGSRGMKAELHRMLGDMLEHKDYVQQIQKATPTIWQQLTVAMDFMIKVAELKEKYGPAIDFFQRAIPFFGGDTSANS